MFRLVNIKEISETMQTMAREMERVVHLFKANVFTAIILIKLFNINVLGWLGGRDHRRCDGLDGGNNNIQRCHAFCYFSEM